MNAGPPPAAPLRKPASSISAHPSALLFMRVWPYGCFDAASAVLANGRLTVRVAGVQPGRGFDVMLSAYAPDPHGSADVEMGLYWRARPAEAEGAATPYAARAEV